MHHRQLATWAWLLFPLLVVGCQSANLLPLSVQESPPPAITQPSGFNVTVAADEKATQNPKLDTALNKLYQTWQQSSQEAVQGAASQGLIVKDDAVLVALLVDEAGFSSQVLNALAALKVEISTQFENQAEVWVPVAQLEALTQIEGIRMVSQPSSVIPTIP